MALDLPAPKVPDLQPGNYLDLEQLGSADLITGSTTQASRTAIGSGPTGEVAALWAQWRTISTI